MALIISAATGNFNAGATWVGGIVPGAADEARASTGHTVTITANVTCTELSNAGTGLFILNSGVTLTANVTHKSATANVNCLQFTAASPSTASIVGNITGASAASATTVFGAVINTSSGTLSITGNCTSGSSLNGNAVTNNSSGITTITGNCLGANSNAIFNASSGTVTIIGNCTGGTTSSGICVYNGTAAATGSVNITGTVTGGSNATAYGVGNFGSGAVTITGNITASTAAGVLNNSIGSVTITGNITAATAAGVTNNSIGSVTITGNITASTAAGVLNTSTGPVTITGTLTPTTAVHALQCTNTTGANITLSGSLIYASNGFAPTNCLKFLVNPTPTMAKVRFAKNGSTTYSDFFTADNSLGQAAITDVRFGTVYASGTLTGVSYIPSASSVGFGVPVDSTTGTATLTAADVRAAIGMASANLDTQLSTISTKTSEVHAIHGLDIANALTVTPTSRTSGAITQSITGDGTTSTIVTRV